MSAAALPSARPDGRGRAAEPQTGVVVGAYVNSPSRGSWDPAAEGRYLAGIAELPRVRGLELPWTGALHPHDDAWLLAHLAPRWDVVLTGLPGTMSRIGADPAFGLASDDEEGRRAAVAEARKMHDGVRRLVDAAGRSSVLAVEIHSGPSRSGTGAGASGSGAALGQSLAEISAWDWQGAALLVEHCDALVPGHPPVKGFLALDDEIAAIRASGTPAGVSLNWGRSALETRSAEGALDHIRRAREAGLLRSIVFSGVSNAESAYGAAWDDKHTPFGPTPGFDKTEPTSILGPGQIREALAAAGRLDWLGCKLAWRPRDASIDERVDVVRQGVEMLLGNSPAGA